MRRAPTAIGTAETGYGDTYVRQDQCPRDQIAFMAAGQDKHSRDAALFRDVIHMAVAAFVASEMSPQSGGKTAGTVGAAKVQIGAGR